MFEQGVVFKPSVFAITRCSLCSFVFLIPISSYLCHPSFYRCFYTWSRCPSVQVCPKSCPSPARKSILAIVDIKVWRTLHKWLLLPLGWSIWLPQEFSYYFISLFNLPDTGLLPDAIFCARGRSLNRIKVFNRRIFCISTVAMHRFQKHPKTMWENTMAGHAWPSYFPTPCVKDWASRVYGGFM